MPVQHFGTEEKVERRQAQLQMGALIFFFLSQSQLPQNIDSVLSSSPKTRTRAQPSKID